MSRPGEIVSLRTADGVRLCALHQPGPAASGAIVLLHGFTGSWRQSRTRDIFAALGRFGGVVAVDFRGHGASRGTSTVGDKEVWDVEAAVRFARDRGYATVTVLGYSMGAAVAVRHAALYRGVDAVAAVSGPAHWYYRGTYPMRMLHHGVERAVGRFVTRAALRTRISSAGWRQLPLTPEELAGKIAPTPLLVVHGDRDAFFPLRHAYAIRAAAGQPAELWIERGMGHAETAMDPALVARLGSWLSNSAGAGPGRDDSPGVSGAA